MQKQTSGIPNQCDKCGSQLTSYESSIHETRVFVCVDENCERRGYERTPDSFHYGRKN